MARGSFLLGLLVAAVAVAVAAVAVVPLMMGDSVSAAMIMEEAASGKLIVNTTLPDYPVIVNGVDVMAELRSLRSEMRAHSGWQEGPHACADNPPRPGTKCNTGIADGDTRPWTLAARFANDGVETWTWNNCDLWSNTELLSELGDVADYKGESFLIPGEDLLFVADNGEWIAYEGALKGQPVHALFQGIPRPCMRNCTSFQATRHNVANDPKRCDFSVYLNPTDGDYSSSQLRVTTRSTCGFAWSFIENDACPLDDVGHSGGLGPIFPEESTERPPVGFLGFDAMGTVQHIELYVR